MSVVVKEKEEMLGAIVCSLGAALAEAETPRPEHPNPQMERAEWLNLNGIWEYGESNEDASVRFLSAEVYPDQILVPFCRECKLSGLERKEFTKNVWYRRTFTVPEAWSSPRKRLHIGACDWKTTVWVNGVRVGEHIGGNVSFAFDITDALTDGSNSIVIRAFDDTASGLQALGKQSITGQSQGIFYTPTTGIWQTVWLEGVGQTFIEGLRLEPQTNDGTLHATILVDGPTDGLSLHVSTRSEMGEATVTRDTLKWRDNRLALELPGKRLWSPADPFLYPVCIELRRGNEVIDRVDSYTGLREVKIDGAAILINGEPIFQRLILDQGYFPEGLWTAPSDDALRKDIELSMAAGFNGARLHQKVFEPRYLYWADKLGYLCWGEFPSYGADYGNAAVNVPIIREWNEIVERDRNHPSIIGWCPFNETPPEAAAVQDAVVHLTRQLDPSRPCLETSGWTHKLKDPEVMDAHDYDQTPQTFKERYDTVFLYGGAASIPPRYDVEALPYIPFMISEYGGIGWSLDEDAWGYGNTPKSLQEYYSRFAGLAEAIMANPRIFGLCYTQLCDVEQEQNGLYHYDRSPKFDITPIVEVVRKRAAYEDAPPTRDSIKPKVNWQVLIGSTHDGLQARPWTYTTMPDGHDTKWEEGLAPFGFKGGEWMDRIRTEWRTNSFAAKQVFEYDGAPIDAAVVIVHHDDDAKIMLNGELLWARKRWLDKYETFDVTARAKAHLRQGLNEVIVHVKQEKGGQYFDMAFLVGRHK